MKIVAQAHEHLVSQCMQEESKLIGQESMTAESVHVQVILEGLDEVLGLPSVCVVVIPPAQRTFPESNPAGARPLAAGEGCDLTQ